MNKWKLGPAWVDIQSNRRVCWVVCWVVGRRGDVPIQPAYMCCCRVELEYCVVRWHCALVLMSQSSRLELFVCYFYAICTLFFFLYNRQHSCLGSFRKKLVRNWHSFIIGNMWLMFTFIFCPACPGASIFLFCFFFLMIFLQYSIKKL